MTTEPLLIAQSLSKRFGSGNNTVSVLDSVSLEVSPRETVAIVGPSGSGKTTLLSLCAGLDTPTSGQVILAGHEISSASEDERARVRRERVGFIFQQYALLPSLTALENVLIPLELSGRKDGKEEARALLDRVGLSDRMHHYPAQLSGGEQQRVALARAFINRPEILFADEPTGSLDAVNAESATALIFSLNRDFGTSLILVTHNAELARSCGRVVSISAGRVPHE